MITQVLMGETTLMKRGGGKYLLTQDYRGVGSVVSWDTFRGNVFGKEMYHSEEEDLRGSRETNGGHSERGKGRPKLHISWSGNRSNLRGTGSG